MGRPSSFKPEYSEQAAKLCKLGATDKELADFFGCDEATLNRWKSEFPEFRASLKRAKEEADERVEQSLYRRALGYSHEAVKIFKNRGEDAVHVPYTEHYAPDTVACIFWLKNRRPDVWRDVRTLEKTNALPEEQRQKLIASILDRLSPPTATAAKTNGSAH